MPHNLFLSYLGQHTLPIYALHILVYMFLYEFFKLHHKVSWANAQSASLHIAQLFVFLALGLGIPLLLLQLYDKVKRLLGSVLTKEVDIYLPPMTVNADTTNSQLFEPEKVPT